MRILLVEDEEALALGIQKGLAKHGYAVDVISDGSEALTRLSVHRSDYDAAIIDLMLPGMSGHELCLEARVRGVVVPILVLTARAETENKVQLLQDGADDYLVKPFSFEELVARLQALMRRPTQKMQEILRVHDIELNPATHTVHKEGVLIELTLKEFSLLEYFMRHPNEAVQREELAAHVWDFNNESFSNVIDVHVKNLRKKLGEPNGVGILETVRGVGYRLRT